MLVVTNTIKVKEGAGAALAERFAGAGGVQDMPGFVRLEVWHGSAKEGAEELKICTVWENEEAFKGWTASESFRNSHRGRAATTPFSGVARQVRASPQPYSKAVKRTAGQQKRRNAPEREERFCAFSTANRRIRAVAFPESPGDCPVA